VENIEQEKVAMPALNGRFGASGGVAPQKMQWEYERL
jgi:hypothetical protein